MDELKQFLPTGANFGPFLSLAPGVQVALAIFLGFVALVALFRLVYSVWKAVNAGDNPGKAAAAKSEAKRAAIILALVVFIVPLTGFVVLVFNTVKNAL
jgi:cytochrome b561